MANFFFYQKRVKKQKNPKQKKFKNQSTSISATSPQLFTVTHTDSTSTRARAAREREHKTNKKNMAKGNKKKARKKAQKAAAAASGSATTASATTTITTKQPLNDFSNAKTVPSPSKPIRLPSPEQAASLEKLQSFPTPTKSNGKDVEKTPEYVWKAPYEPGSAWADQTDSDMFKRGEEKKGESTPAMASSPGGKRLSMTPQSAAKESPKNLTEASPGKTEKVIAEATSPARIPEAKKTPTPKKAPTPAPAPAAVTRQPSPLSRQSQPQYAQQQQTKVPTPQRKAEIERKSFIERTFTPAKEKLDKNPLIAEIVREREEAAANKQERGGKSGENSSFLGNTLANLKENKIAAIGIGAGAVALLLSKIGEGKQKNRS